jgi:hypothetical protein
MDAPKSSRGKSMLRTRPKIPKGSWNKYTYTRELSLIRLNRILHFPIFYVASLPAYGDKVEGATLELDTKHANPISAHAPVAMRANNAASCVVPPPRMLR